MENNSYFFNLKRVEVKIEKCEWSDKYKTYIHRYDTGAMVCRCGKDRVQPSTKLGGWRSK